MVEAHADQLAANDTRAGRLSLGATNLRCVPLPTLPNDDSAGVQTRFRHLGLRVKATATVGHGYSGARLQ